MLKSVFWNPENPENPEDIRRNHDHQSMRRSIKFLPVLKFVLDVDSIPRKRLRFSTFSLVGCITTLGVKGREQLPTSDFEVPSKQMPRYLFVYMVFIVFGFSFHSGKDINMVFPLLTAW